MKSRSKGLAHNCQWDFMCRLSHQINGKYRKEIKAVSIYCCPDCLSCPASAIQMDQGNLGNLGSNKDIQHKCANSHSLICYIQ